MTPSAGGRQPDMFRQQGQASAHLTAPLAARLRPTTLDTYVGQQHLLGEGKVLRRAIEADRVPSMILWGPPGTGKTTLASVIAAATGAEFIALSAVMAGVADLRRVVEEARNRRDLEGRRTILFIDEIHRFNKAQQDVVLPHVEAGLFTLIGATTENPSFEVNAALLSRCRVYVHKALTEDELTTVLDRALTDPHQGLGADSVTLDDDTRAFLLNWANGDARSLLNALELVATLAPTDGGPRRITLDHARNALQHRALGYDKSGDNHYDTISAFIKSLRGSDPDAAVYWLARMLDAGEDPLFITRRMVILASEDVGLADPQALVLATACQQAVHFLGMPEAIYPLTQTALYLALAPKSNSAGTTYQAALRDVRETATDPVPLHLRNAATGLMRDLGYGRGYQYAHDFEGHTVDQQYLPDNLTNRRYYTPGTQGAEPNLHHNTQRTRDS